jgi:hypothetical protein
MPIIFSADLISTATITAVSTASGYAAANLLNFINLKRNWRMNTANKSDSVAALVFDFTTAKTIAAVVLDDVNFDKVIIKGHASSLSNWDTATFSSGTISISKDAKTNRYKAFIPLTSFDYRYMAVLIPTTAAGVGDYTTKWQAGRVGPLDSYYTFGRNMDWGYQRGASQTYDQISFQNGRRERGTVGIRRWEATLNFNSPRRISTEEIDLDTLNNYDMDDPLIFYENEGDTSKVYFCYRDTDYFGTYTLDDGVSGNSIKLVELI